MNEKDLQTILRFLTEEKQLKLGRHLLFIERITAKLLSTLGFSIAERVKILQAVDTRIESAIREMASRNILGKDIAERLGYCVSNVYRRMKAMVR